jgi:hypothetical protein
VKKTPLRNTPYAKELQESAKIQFSDGSEVRCELIYIKSQEEPEIRLSWWRGRRMLPRPLDLPEGQLAELIAEVINSGVLGPGSFDASRHGSNDGRG